jgi:predicted nucleic acid-binding protein
MSAKFFLDTNVLVYLFDRSAPEKSARARELVEAALAERNGLISYQVVQEFLNVATKKFAIPVPGQEALPLLRDFLEPLCTVFSTFELFELAIAVRDETGFSYYDSLICAGAIIGGAKVLYSEDMQDGRSVRGVLIKNPFR